MHILSKPGLVSNLNRHSLGTSQSILLVTSHVVIECSLKVVAASRIFVPFSCVFVSCRGLFQQRLSQHQWRPRSIAPLMTRKAVGNRSGCQSAGARVASPTTWTSHAPGASTTLGVVWRPMGMSIATRSWPIVVRRMLAASTLVGTRSKCPATAATAVRP